MCGSTNFFDQAHLLLTKLASYVIIFYVRVDNIDTVDVSVDVQAFWLRNSRNIGTSVFQFRNFGK